MGSALITSRIDLDGTAVDLQGTHPAVARIAARYDRTDRPAEHCVTVAGADATARPAAKAWLSVDGAVLVSDRRDEPVADALEANLAVLRAKAAHSVVAAAVLRRDDTVVLAPPALRDATITVRTLARHGWSLLPLALVVLHLDPLSAGLPDGTSLRVGRWVVPDHASDAGAVAAAASVRLRAPDTLADLLRVIDQTVIAAPEPHDAAGWLQALGDETP